MTNARLESTITGIGQILFGSPDGDITPEFSRVLRSRILRKDDRWMVFHAGDSSGIDNRDSDNGMRVVRVVPGATSTENPFHIPAELGSEN